MCVCLTHSLSSVGKNKGRDGEGDGAQATFTTFLKILKQEGKMSFKSPVCPAIRDRNPFKTAKVPLNILIIRNKAMIFAPGSK